MFTGALHWSLSSARSIQSIPPHPVSKIHFTIIHPPMSYMHSSSPHSCYMPCQSHPTSYGAPHYAVFFNLLSLHLSSVQIFSSAPCSQAFSTYVCSFLNVKRPSFTPIQNHRQNYRFVYSNFYVFRQQMRRQYVLD
jgi:hypothetical protein